MGTFVCRNLPNLLSEGVCISICLMFCKSLDLFGWWNIKSGCVWRRFQQQAGDVGIALLKHFGVCRTCWHRWSCQNGWASAARGDMWRRVDPCKHGMRDEIKAQPLVWGSHSHSKKIRQGRKPWSTMNLWPKQRAVGKLDKAEQAMCDFWQMRYMNHMSIFLTSFNQYSIFLLRYSMCCTSLSASLLDLWNCLPQGTKLAPSLSLMFFRMVSIWSFLVSIF